MPEENVNRKVKCNTSLETVLNGFLANHAYDLHETFGYGAKFFFKQEAKLEKLRSFSRLMCNLLLNEHHLMTFK